MTGHKPFKLVQIFKDVKKGTIHETNILDEGKIPVVGCGFENRGIEGWFDLPSEDVFENAITITGDGSYLLTMFYHEYPFGAKDNVTICIPKEGTPLSVIYYVAYIINYNRWKFSYGRKCYLRKMLQQEFILPVNDQGDLDTKYIEDKIRINFEINMEYPFNPNNLRRTTNNTDQR
jgi:type I restriction enzyme M protein